MGYFAKEFNPGADPAIARKIIDYVEEWLEGQLVEAIMTVRNLVNGRTWTPVDIDRAHSIGPDIEWMLRFVRRKVQN